MNTWEERAMDLLVFGLVIMALSVLFSIVFLSAIGYQCVTQYSVADCIAGEAGNDE